MIQLPLKMSVGEDFYLPLQWQFQVCDNFYPQDITGYGFEMQIGLSPFSQGQNYIPPIIDISTANGDITVDGPNGKVEFRIPKAIVTPYMFGCWKYAVAATNTIGLVEKLFSGEFLIEGWC